MRMKRRIILFLVLLGFFLPMLVMGAEGATAAVVAPKHSPVDFLWIIIAGILVFFMQPGFALVETGLTRAKNSGNILMKNVMDFSIGSIAYFLVGWALMYGTGKSIMGLFSFDDFLVTSATVGGNEGMWIYANWFFQAMFAATAATIVSGAVAGRTKFSTYLIFSVAMTAFIYPVSGHWIWSAGGWLVSKFNFHDFAGSTVVHTVGGMAALAGAILVGARTGKYGKDGKAKAIPGHSMPLAALGVFILFFGWFGFNAGSTLGYSDKLAHVAVTTALAGGAGALGAMFTVWIWFKKPGVSMTLNGVLAGLVAITAGANVVSPVSAIIIGLLGGIIVVFSVEFIDKVLKIDDPVGAVSVHGVVGIWGTLAVGLFGEKAFSGSFSGLFFGGGWSQLGSQALGTFTVALWAFGIAFIVLFILKKTIGLRVSKEEEIKGLDIEEHGTEAYSGFQIIE